MALRRIIDLMSSLNEIPTSPDFLAQVRVKIERQEDMPGLRARLFEPARLKVSLQVMGLFLLMITAFYISRQPIELPEDGGTPTALQAARETAIEGTAEKTAKGASLQATEANLTAPPQIQEVMADDVGGYEHRVKILLAELGGKVLIQESFSGSGLLLTIEMPESRRAELFSALKGEDKPISKGEREKKIAVSTSTTASHEPTAAHESDPSVTFQLRIVPKL